MAAAPTPRTAGGAKTLEQPYYTDATLFALERERIFHQHWCYVGRREEVPAPGDFLVVKLEGESIILVRGEDGVLRAFYNLCRHRGTQLCLTQRGHRSAFRCPYHAWTYGLDGRLLGAPNMHEVESFRREDYPLHQASVLEREGCVLLHLGDEPAALTPTYESLFTKFGAWRLGALTVAHRERYEVEANWKLLFQNYSECYHCPTLHPALNQLTPYRGSSNDLEEGLLLGGPMRMPADVFSMTTDGLRCASPLPTTGVPEDLHAVYYYTLFPNFFVSLHPDYVLIHQIERVSPSRSVVHCVWLFAPEDVARADFDPMPAVAFWDKTNREDWGVCEASQRGISSKAYVPGPYAELESIVAAFDRAYLAALGEVVSSRS